METGAPTTWIDRDSVAVTGGDALSCTATVNNDMAGVVGVPEMIPEALSVIPWGNWGTLNVTPVPDAGSAWRIPLPIASEDPVPLTVTEVPTEIGRASCRERVCYAV